MQIVTRFGFEGRRLARIPCLRIASSILVGCSDLIVHDAEALTSMLAS
jgi:hypothetical protein